jgi:FkbM family methyltransferase
LKRTLLEALKGKLSTAKRVLQTQGLAGLHSVFWQKLDWSAHLFDPWDNWLCGRLVELRGNVVNIGGCTFNVNNPIISTRLKSRFLFNQYETPEREAIERFLDPSLPVIELGGAIGVVACITNRKLANPNDHVVVEANPALIPLLEENRDRNKCSFTIESRAYAYGRESAVFHSNATDFLGSSTLVYRAAEPSVDTIVKDAVVKTTNLQTILDQYSFNRCTLICDIEGGEAELLSNESVIVRDRVSTLIIEIHAGFLGKDKMTALIEQMTAMGFESIYQNGETFVFSKL